MVGEMVRIRVSGREIVSEKGVSLIEVLISAGIMLRSDCGGHGRCGKCLLRIETSEYNVLSEPNESERKFLLSGELSAGLRLACQTKVFGDIGIEIPEDSLLALEVAQKDLPALASRLNSLPPNRVPLSKCNYGVAVDVGTTTIAVYLCNMKNHAVVASTSVRNPQALFGDDVISRISAVRMDPDILPRLQNMTVQAIDWAVSSLCRSVGINLQAIGFVVTVGNSTMIHLLVGEDPSSIGVYPYLPLFVKEKDLLAGDIGLQFNPKAQLRSLPLISGYLGSDIVGAGIATNIMEMPVGTLLVDVGTNGEIMLSTSTGIIATSCATGPAFEGASILHGMQAISGAVDKVQYNMDTGCLNYTVIQQKSGRTYPPSGICGSGVISVVAELRKAGVILESGAFNLGCGSPCLRPGESGVLEFEIVPAENARKGRSLTFTQADVRAVQLAKGALRTGIDLLCRENGIVRLSKLLLAGAFGSHIDKADALQIRMFPPISENTIEIVGNAAGAGAILSLLDGRYSDKAKELAQKTRVFDLSAHPDFQKTFLNLLSL